MNKLLATALGLALTAGLAWQSDDEKEAAAPTRAYEPVASLDALMNGHGMAFGGVRRAMMKSKEDRRRGNDIRVNSELLAEVANINTFWARRDDYRNWAGQLRDTALELAELAKKRDGLDEDKMKAAYEKLDATCTSCHEAYN